MSKKAIRITALLAAVVALSVAGLAEAQYGQPPTITIKSGKKKVKPNGRFVLGRVTCGTGTCNATRKKVRLIVGGTKYKVKTTIATTGPGQTTKIKCKAKPGGVNALQNAGKGKIKFNIRVASSNGQSATRQGKRKAVPA